MHQHVQPAYEIAEQHEQAEHEKAAPSPLLPLGPDKSADDSIRAEREEPENGKGIRVGTTER